MLNEGKLRKKSIDPLTIEEFQKIELLEALEVPAQRLQPWTTALLHQWTRSKCPTPCASLR